MNRNITNKINYILDNIISPNIRDSKFFMAPLFRLALGKKYKYYLKFKEEVPHMTEDRISEYYTILADTFMARDTDINGPCLKRIMKDVRGTKVLDIATGRGYLAKKLYEADDSRKVTGADVVVPAAAEGIEFVKASITKQPFEDKSFDTVICAHTLEHIVDVEKAVAELRRVCRGRLIIVLPRQREYKYTFDLHVHFYPYKYNVEQLLGPKAKVELLGGDWYCVEEMGG